jgi:hypothetical protein
MDSVFEPFVNRFYRLLQTFICYSCIKAAKGRRREQKDANPMLKVGDFALGVELALHIGSIRKAERKSNKKGKKKAVGASGETSEGVSESSLTSETGECILVFLPGEFEILSWHETLDAKLKHYPPAIKDNISVHVLHSQLQRVEMDTAFIPAKPGHLKSKFTYIPLSN